MNTLLFDLDGTLLPLHPETFTKAYFDALCPKLLNQELPLDVQNWLLSATKSVVASEDPSKTNIEKFKQTLFSNMDADGAKEIWSIFELFYNTEFEDLQRLTQPTKIAREICRTAKSKGYRLALTTNPIFPRVATLARVRWAGLDPTDFALITTMENMHYSKPSPKYYLEVLELLDISAEACLMIGNDVQEDGTATYVGIDTYLVTDCLIDRGVGSFPFKGQGKLTDLRLYIESHPPV